MRCDVPRFLLSDIDCEYLPLFPTTGEQRQVHPPEQAICQGGDLDSVLERILQKLGLVLLQWLAGALYFDEDDISACEPEAAVNSSAIPNIEFRNHFLKIIPIPAKPRQNGQNDSLARGFLAANRQNYVVADSPNEVL